MNQTELDTVRERVETAYLQIMETRRLLKMLESEMSEAKLWMAGKRVSFTWLDPDKVMTGIVVTPITDNLYVSVKVEGEAGEFTLRVPISHLKVVEEVQGGN